MRKGEGLRAYKRALTRATLSFLECVRLRGDTGVLFVACPVSLRACVRASLASALMLAYKPARTSDHMHAEAVCIKALSYALGTPLQMWSCARATRL
eukprot:704300-Pleurochrysis_carterae.AAC.1